MLTTAKPFDRADWRVWFYLIAQLVGGIGLSVLLVTMIWPTKKRKPRNPLLISLCFSWWISTFPCLCILYYTRQVTGPPPTYPICLASAVLTMGQSILVATTAPALLFNIWLIVKTAVRPRFTNNIWIPRSTLICLVAPYVFFVSFIGASLALGLIKPQIVHRVLFYCVVDDAKLTVAIGVFGTASLLAAILLQIWTVVLLYKNRSCIRQLTHDGHISLVVRVCLFGVYVFLGLCLNVISIIDWTNPVPDLFFSTFGIAVFLVFGTQRDIWRIWRDASRHITSSRSHCSSSHSHYHYQHQQHSSYPTLPIPPLRPFALHGDTQRSRHPLSTSQRHLSLSQFNYSRSFSQSVSQSGGLASLSGEERRISVLEGREISLPMPAMLRESSSLSLLLPSIYGPGSASDSEGVARPPAIVIHHSTPDLSRSGLPTPEEAVFRTPDVGIGFGIGAPPVPEKDARFLSPRLVQNVSGAGEGGVVGSGLGMFRGSPVLGVAVLPELFESRPTSFWEEGGSRAGGEEEEDEDEAESVSVYSYPPTADGTGEGGRAGGDRNGSASRGERERWWARRLGLGALGFGRGRGESGSGEAERGRRDDWGREIDSVGVASGESAMVVSVPGRVGQGEESLVEGSVAGVWTAL